MVPWLNMERNLEVRFALCVQMLYSTGVLSKAFGGQWSPKLLSPADIVAILFCFSVLCDVQVMKSLILYCSECMYLCCQLKHDHQHLRNCLQSAVDSDPQIFSLLPLTHHITLAHRSCLKGFVRFSANDVFLKLQLSQL